MDDAVHKTPYKEKTHGQNQLKNLVLVYFKVIYSTVDKKKYIILIQYPLRTSENTLCVA